MKGMSALTRIKTILGNTMYRNCGAVLPNKKKQKVAPGLMEAAATKRCLEQGAQPFVVTF